MLIEDVIGSSTTTDVQLNNLAKRLFGAQFIGVYSADNFPKNIKNSQCYIMNTDTHVQHGTHWVSVYRYNNRYYYYDSFGRDINKLSPFWQNLKWMKVIDNRHREESYNGANCGQLSLNFLVMFDKYKLKLLSVI